MKLMCDLLTFNILGVEFQQISSLSNSQGNCVSLRVIFKLFMTEISQQLVRSTKVLSISDRRIQNSNFCYAIFIFVPVWFSFYAQMNLFLRDLNVA